MKNKMTATVLILLYVSIGLKRCDPDQDDVHAADENRERE